MLKLAMNYVVPLMILAIGAGQVVAQSSTPKMTTHRQSAGILDDEGWTEASSTLGNYSLKLPGKFNDLTLTQQNPNSAVEKAEVLTTTTVQRIHFTATRLKFRQGKSGAIKQFESIKVAGSKAPYKSMKPMSLNGHTALEAEIEGKNSVAVQRTVLLEDDLFTLIVEYPKAQEAVAQRLAPTFFGSVTFH